MIVAVREDHIEMAEFLLKERADVNIFDRDQRSVPNHCLSNIITSDFLNSDELFAVMNFPLQVSIDDSCWQWTDWYVAAFVAVRRRYRTKR